MAEMASHGRKYGQKDSYPFPVWNGILEHSGRIACAIWVFLWCLDKVTKEKDGIGIVLGGAPVKITRIAADLKMGEHTVRRHCEGLQKQNYIRRRRTPYGFVIEVLNSRKFGIWHAREGVQKRPVFQPKLAGQTGKNGRNKEDAAVDSAVDAAVKASAGKSSFWEVIGVNPGSLTPGFRELCEGIFSTKKEQPMGEFVGLCMDAWETQGNRIPPQFAKAAAGLREKANKETKSQIPELEALPWGKQ